MKLRPLGSGPATPWSPAGAPAPRPRDTIGHAVVSARDQSGVPTALGLPGPLAGKQVGLFVEGPRGRAWAAAVNASGAIGWDFRDGAAPRPKELARITPGTKIVAAIDRGGNVLSLMAVPRK